MTNTTRNRPVYQRRLPHGISAAVFQNTRDDGSLFRSVNIQRSYRKGDSWQRMGIYLDHEHLPFMIEALQAAWKFLNEGPASSQTAETASEVEAETAEAA